MNMTLPIWKKHVFKINIFDDAKQNKLTSWKSNNVYQVLPNTNRKCIYLRWVYNLKAIINGARPKPLLWRREFNNNLYQIQIYPHAPTTHWEQFYQPFFKEHGISKVLQKNSLSARLFCKTRGVCETTHLSWL